MEKPAKAGFFLGYINIVSMDKLIKVNLSTTNVSEV